MPLNLPTFYTRTLTAIVFVIVMLTGLLWNMWSFTALVCLIQFLCLKEYFMLMKKIFPDTKWELWQQVVIQIIGFCFVIYFSRVISERLMSYRYEGLRACLYFVLVLVPAGTLMLSTMRKNVSLQAMLYSFGGLLYISFPMVLLQLLYDINASLPLALLMMIWINDTMAYIVGSFIGKTPLSAISPKKTWEGTIGGAILTVAVAVGITVYFHNKDVTFLFHIHWVALAFCAAIAGNLGDLFESKLKRLAGVKDSGKIMPGHGGALDRFDSLLVATPFAFACYIVLGA